MTSTGWIGTPGVNWDNGKYIDSLSRFTPALPDLPLLTVQNHLMINCSFSLFEIQRFGLFFFLIFKKKSAFPRFRGHFSGHRGSSKGRVAGIVTMPVALFLVPFSYRKCSRSWAVFPKNKFLSFLESIEIVFMTEIRWIVHLRFQKIGRKVSSKLCQIYSFYLIILVVISLNSSFQTIF